VEHSTRLSFPLLPPPHFFSPFMKEPTVVVMAIDGRPPLTPAPLLLPSPSIKNANWSSLSPCQARPSLPPRALFPHSLAMTASCVRSSELVVSRHVPVPSSPASRTSSESCLVRLVSSFTGVRRRRSVPLPCSPNSPCARRPKVEDEPSTF
jgi:hypothetical protein